MSGDTVSAAAHNQHSTKVRKQPGGCAVIARGQLAHRSSQRIYDTLGHWTMMSFRSKNGLWLRVVSVCKPRAIDGPYTIYQQQIQYYNEEFTESTNSDPLMKYDNDLTSLITG